MNSTRPQLTRMFRSSLYRGAGSDTHMNALLIQRRSETEASLSLWLHDGSRWAVESAEPILGLPLRGRVRLTRENAEMQLDIDGRVDSR